jgi:hypothetical protein
MRYDTVETERKIDDTLVDELTERLRQTEQETAFPPSKEKAGTVGGE